MTRIAYQFRTTRTYDEICPIPQDASAARRVDTSTYEINIGRKPRGRGRWVFEVMQADGTLIMLTFSGWQNLSYGEAKKHALTLAKTYGFIAIHAAS